MGKMIRWLKKLFGFKTESNSDHRNNKIPSCIGRSRRDPTNSPPQTPLCNNHYEAQSIRAIAVAAATAAAADAAVAATQAAFAFVRLTSQRRVTAITAGDRENLAAIRIQSWFRGYLSRKALKALKSLVKLQALVRGYLVRKQAVQTLQGMEAMFRARSSVAARKFRLQDDEFYSRKSTISHDGRSNTIELGLKKPNSRFTRANTWAWAADETPSPLFTNPRHYSTPGSSNFYGFEPRFSTTHNTPRFAYSCGPDDTGSIYDGLSKDDCFAGHPGYMANTKSFRAKVRSHSAPRQRPEFGLGVQKSDGLIDVEYGLRIKKSKSKSKNSFKNYVMDWKVIKKST